MICSIPELIVILTLCVLMPEHLKVCNGCYCVDTETLLKSLLSMVCLLQKMPLALRGAYLLYGRFLNYVCFILFLS